MMVEFGSEKEVAVTDPVCGMPLALDETAAQVEYGGWAYFFCSDACHKLFVAAPKRYSSSPAQLPSAPTDMTK